MARLLRAFPLLPGKREAFEKFVAELKARHAETDAFYQGHGVVRETAHLQSTPLGPECSCVLDWQDTKSLV